MEANIEQVLSLSGVEVNLGTVRWDGVEETPAYDGYCLSQRLSADHSPLRIGNLPAPSVLPRVRSVGLLPPGQSVRMLPVETPLRVVCCIFDQTFFENITGIGQQHWHDHIENLVSIRNHRLEILMQEIYGELQEPDFGGELVIESVSTMIAIELGRHMRGFTSRDAGARSGCALAPAQLRRIEERLRASLEVGYPSLSELASLCGISEGHLARSFKAATGWRIHEYITEERLSAAKSMLVMGNASCGEIATRLGFKSTAYFSTAFRRMTGKTPTQYRKQVVGKRVTI